MKVRSLVGLSVHSAFHRWSAQCAALLLLSVELMSCAAGANGCADLRRRVFPLDGQVSSGADVQAPWNYMLETSGVASPEILGGKMFDFRRITLFCLEKHLSKHKMTIFSKNLGRAWPLRPPTWLRLCSRQCGSFATKLSMIATSSAYAYFL